MNQEKIKSIHAPLVHDDSHSSVRSKLAAKMTERRSAYHPVSNHYLIYFFAMIEGQITFRALDKSYIRYEITSVFRPDEESFFIEENPDETVTVSFNCNFDQYEKTAIYNFLKTYSPETVSGHVCFQGPEYGERWQYRFNPDAAQWTERKGYTVYKDVQSPNATLDALMDFETLLTNDELLADF